MRTPLHRLLGWGQSFFGALGAALPGRVADFPDPIMEVTASLARLTGADTKSRVKRSVRGCRRY